MPVGVCAWETIRVSSLDRLPPMGRPDNRGRLGQERSDVDLHKDRGLDLTPAERMRRRSNRRWMIGVGGGSVLILAAALAVSAIEAARAPSGPQIAVPAGYQAVNDGYFSYAVPLSWSTNPAYTDQAGDVETSGPSGWAGQHIDYLVHAPLLGEAPPSALGAFGQAAPSPLSLAGGHTIAVKGASIAYEYQASRPNGFHAVVINAWTSNQDVELWLIVYAPPAQTSQILDTLEG